MSRLAIIALIAQNLVFVAPPASAAISDGMNASHVLGQRDADVTATVEPYFYKAGAQDGMNRFGFSAGGGTAIDPIENRLFLADTNGRVLVYNLNGSNVLTDYVADYVLGDADFNGTPAGSTQADMTGVSGVAFDANNQRLFVVDYPGHRVLVFDVRDPGSADTTSCGTTTDGLANGMDASCVIGQPDFDTNDYLITQDGLGDPQAVEYDANNDRLFVSTSVSVRAYDVRSDVGGAPGSTSSCGTSTTGIANGMNASCVLGPDDFTSIVGDLDDPNGMAYDHDDDRLFVADALNNRVVSFDVRSDVGGAPGSTSSCGTSTTGIANGMDFSCILGGMGPGAAQDSLDTPEGVAYDNVNDRLFVAEYANNRLTMFDVRSDVGGTPGDVTYCGETTNGIADNMNASCVLGKEDFTSQTPITPATDVLNTTLSATYDPDNDVVYVHDAGNARVMVFDVEDAVLDNGDDAIQVIGQYDADAFPTVTPVFDKGAFGPNAPNRIGMLSPYGSALDLANDRLFVADRDNNRVLVYELTGGVPTDIIPDMVLGQPDFNSMEGSLSGASDLYAPVSLALDADGERLFVVDGGNNRVVTYDTGALATGMAADNVLGQDNFGEFDVNSGEAGVVADGFNAPFGVAYDAHPGNERLFVSDSANSRVLVYDLSDGLGNGEDAAYVLGQDSLTVDGDPNSGEAGVVAEGMSAAHAIAYDYDGDRLFATDPNNNRVLVFDVSAGNIGDGIAADNVLGQDSLTVDGDIDSGEAGPVAEGMNTPSGVEYDATNDRLFVADSFNNRILAFDASAITDGMAADNVLGQDTFTTNDWPVAGPDALGAPSAVMYDGVNDRLFVGDTGNNRVLAFSSAGPSGGPAPSLTDHNKVLMTRLKAGATSDVVVSFNLANATDGEETTITFPAGFQVLDAPDDGLSSPCFEAPYSFSFTDLSTPSTVTATKGACGTGPLYVGGFSVVNPSSVGTYTVTWTNDDEGYSLVPIIVEDQITVTASVDPTITFDVGADSDACDDGWSSTDHALPLGALALATTKASDEGGIDHVCTKLSTNATHGATVTVRSANGASGLASLSVPADDVDSASGTIAAGTENYGICSRVGTVSGSAAGDVPANGSLSVASCSGPTPAVTGFTGGSQVAWTVDATVDAYAQFNVAAAISASTAPHADYQDILTWIATATF